VEGGAYKRTKMLWPWCCLQQTPLYKQIKKMNSRLKLPKSPKQFTWGKCTCIANYASLYAVSLTNNYPLIRRQSQ
jgi:hypothetical protein